MELRHLRYFLTVAEELNFTRAAEKLMIAQPPLSRQIRDLEDELGTPLFIRQHHALQLTEAGQLFRRYAYRIVAMADKSVDDIRLMHRGLQGMLYIAEVEGKAPHLVSGWIAGFAQEYPDVQYSLWNGDSDEVVKRVRAGLCDVAVVMEPFEHHGLHTRKVYHEPWVAIFPDGHPLAGKMDERVYLEELAQYDLIVPAKESRLQTITERFAQMGAEPRVRARISNTLNVYELVEQGMGVAIYPAAAADLIRDDGLKIREIVNPAMEATYVLIWSAEHVLSPVAEKFIEFIHDTLPPET